MADTTPLAPCPFCGAPAHGYAIEPHSHSPSLMRLIPELPDHPGSYVIEGQCACGSGLIGADAARLEIESLKSQSAAQQPDIENLRKALQFYAGSEHFIKSDGDAWDTVSGEPQNYWCDEAGTATVEDGSIARLALSGQPVQFEDDTPQSEQPGAAYAAQDSEHQLAIMEGERNASLDAYSSVVYLTGAESRLYEAGFTSGWDRRDRLASHGQAPAQAAPDVSGYVSEWAGGICTAGEAMAGIAKLYEAQATPAYNDSTPDLHVGDSSFESWYADYVKEGTKGLKQHCRDAYAAGMVDPLVMAAPAAVAGCTRSHPHENMDNACRAKAAIAEMRSMAARGAEATAQDLERFVSMLAAAPTTQPAPQPSPAAQGDALDAARWHWLAEYLVGPRTDLDDEIVASETVDDLKKLVDAARAAQEGKSHGH